MGNDWGQLAVVIGALGAIVGAFLRYLSKTNETFSGTITEINDRNLTHNAKLAEESAERSQAMRECLTENNRLIGRACNILDRHDRLLNEYEQQGKLRSNT